MHYHESKTAITKCAWADVSNGALKVTPSTLRSNFLFNLINDESNYTCVNQQSDLGVLINHQSYSDSCFTAIKSKHSFLRLALKCAGCYVLSLLYKDLIIYFIIMLHLCVSLFFVISLTAKSNNVAIADTLMTF